MRMSRDNYEVIIGLEVHAELSTRTKIFCSCPTEFGAAPNLSLIHIQMCIRDRCDLIAYSNGHYYSLGKKLGKFGFSVQKKKKKK